MPIPTDHLKPVRLSAKENAFNQLQQWIIDGTLLPGEKLNDTELAKALGVSRTPIRESLQLLESQGFVKMYPGKATQVTEIEKESIKDILPPLAVLQSLSAELAVANLSHETLELLKKTNQQFSDAIKSENYYSALKVDEQFHKIIVDTTGNTYIQGMLDSLQAHVRRLFFHNSIILTDKSIDDHWRIIELMEAKDTETLATVMKKNWLRTMDAF
ncbi:GntR family transcriptional regulator [Oceanobacillus polygoni]|uniref:DNA-binding GntR family transcriptional regulator n=1 Tax=Oceanobacillus polygoni TaxID=1235259 RepID=A0A9X1CKR6_9BACI|nr:GntR family transcriptional regulator [Oceanobacillus polygoni]MBP2079512.1 DNA-binding GntR family transcriptional regulator [Oceanobacillus polygoni]